VNVDRAVLVFAGSIVLLSLVLAWLVPIAFRKLGLKTGPAFECPQLQDR
jgi:hypothetical protein